MSSPTILRATVLCSSKPTSTPALGLAITAITKKKPLATAIIAAELTDLKPKGTGTNRANKCPNIAEAIPIATLTIIIEVSRLHNKNAVEEGTTNMATTKIFPTASKLAMQVTATSEANTY